MLIDLVRQLRAGGVPDDRIVETIQKLAAGAAEKRSSLQAAGFPGAYVDSLSGPNLFAAGGLPLVTGQEQQQQELQARVAAENALGSRAQGGFSFIDMLRAIDADVRAREQNPFQLAQHLADVSQLGRGEAGNPIQALIGKGQFIQPQLPSYLQGGDFDRVRSSLLDYVAPKTFQTEQRTDPNIARVRAAYQTSEPLARRFFEEASRNPEGVARMFGGAFARGGEMMTDEPMVGMGMQTGAPRFLVGEEGPEKLEITPMRRFADGGTVRTGSTGFSRYKNGRRRTNSIRSGSVGRAMRDLSARQQAAMPGRLETLRMRRDAASALRGLPGGTSTAGPEGVTVGGTRFAGGGTAGNLAATFGRSADQAQRGIDSDNALAQYLQRFGIGGSGGAQASRSSRFAQGSPGEQPGSAERNQPEGRGLEPRQAAALALATALENNPFAPPELIASLKAKGPALPGTLWQFLQEATPTMRNSLLGLAPAFGLNIEDYMDAIKRYNVPGVSLYRE